MTDDLQQKETDFEQKLQKIVGDAAKINIDYGGFEVTVVDNKKLDWKEVFELLLSYGFSIYVSKKDNFIVINGKQRF